MLNNGLNLFTYDLNPSENSFETSKQPRGLMTPIITYNELNLCQRRFSISYSHEHHADSKSEGDDFALTGKLFVSSTFDMVKTKNNHLPPPPPQRG